jgi:hypothetical protein
VQRLVDAAVVVIAVVIPALDFELLKKFLHGQSLLKTEDSCYRRMMAAA